MKYLLLMFLASCAIEHEPKIGECYSTEKHMYKIVEVGKFSYRAKDLNTDNFYILTKAGFSNQTIQVDCWE